MKKIVIVSFFTSVLQYSLAQEKVSDFKWTLIMTNQLTKEERTFRLDAYIPWNLPTDIIPKELRKSISSCVTLPATDHSNKSFVIEAKIIECSSDKIKTTIATKAACGYSRDGILPNETNVSSLAFFDYSNKYIMSLMLKCERIRF
ncbi:MAG: hypothetical protein DCC88_11745 [Spirobacillus cienkowskii]|jgi:hypothetical protein|uniref:Uncharacterized protein n=1 Tax=Spirobacillus cienkowskii TaxID=495820 RepID=A0A369KVG6_9BACT|nr:MAG: hypothetical protein DCC88_11745 [Spirobacillus cienkowskii]